MDSEELPQAPVLDGQPCFHQLHKELGEMHLTELKVKALYVTQSNSSETEGTSSPLNLIQDSELRPKVFILFICFAFWVF